MQGSFFESPLAIFDSVALYNYFLDQPGTCWLPSLAQIEAIQNARVKVSDASTNDHVAAVYRCIEALELPTPRLSAIKKSGDSHELDFLYVPDDGLSIIAGAAILNLPIACRITFGKKSQIENIPAFHHWGEIKPEGDIFGESIICLDETLYEVSCCKTNGRATIKALNGSYILYFGLSPYRVTLFDKGVEQPDPSLLIRSELTEPISCSAFFEEVLTYLPQGFNCGIFYLWFNYCFYEYFEGHAHD